MCVYICTCVHMYSYVYMYLYIYTYIHIYTHIYTYIDIYTHIYTYIVPCCNAKLCPGKFTLVIETSHTKEKEVEERWHSGKEGTMTN